MERIVFYYPSKSIGGAQLLFIRLADYLANFHNFEIYYVDYDDGFSRDFLKTSPVKYIYFIKGKKIKLPDYSIVIIPSNFIFFVDQNFELTDNTMFFFWTIHPENIRSFLIDFRNKTLLSKKNRHKIGGLLVKLYNLGLLHYMDYVNYIFNAKFFEFEITDINYLQIPIGAGILSEYKKEPHHFKKNIRLAWLGRLDKDKINSVKLILNEIDSCNNKSNIAFYIIGVGTEFESLKSLINQYSFKIELLGRLQGDELDDYISNNVDIGVAMGTSAFEIAKRAVPVIMIDVYDKVYPADYMKYDLLHQIKNYSLGSSYPFMHNEKRSQSFKEVIRVILENYEYHSRKSWEYVKENHSIDVVGQKLLNNINNLKWVNQGIQKEILTEVKRIKESHDNSFSVRTINYLRKLIHGS